MQSNPSIVTPVNEASVEKLQECLRSEMAAVETYEMTLGNTTNVGTHRALQEILVSHAARTERLRDYLREVGADVPQSSGVWGAFAKALQTGADVLGDRVAIAALKEGEDRALKLYMEALEPCDPRARRLIDFELLPAQRRTLELCRMLKDYLHTPS